MKKFAIIGAGNLGGAIARGLVAEKICAAEEIVCTAAHAETLARRAEELPGLEISRDNAAAARAAETVILAVKPWLALDVLAEVGAAFAPGTFPRPKRFISVVPGISIDQLREEIDDAGTDSAETDFPKNENARGGNAPAGDARGNVPIFVAIPNTAIAVAQSMTFFAAENGAPASEIEFVEKIFSSLGKAVCVPEAQLAAGTALASCGIAFAMRYVRASTEGAVRLGLRANLAQEAALHTLLGAAQLLLKTGEHPESAIDKVTTPGGMTIRGLNALESRGFSVAVVAGLRACLH